MLVLVWFFGFGVFVVWFFSGLVWVFLLFSVFFFVVVVVGFWFVFFFSSTGYGTLTAPSVSQEGLPWQLPPSEGVPRAGAGAPGARRSPRRRWVTVQPRRRQPLLRGLSPAPCSLPSSFFPFSPRPSPLKCPGSRRSRAAPGPASAAEAAGRQGSAWFGAQRRRGEEGAEPEFPPLKAAAASPPGPSAWNSRGGEWARRREGKAALLRGGGGGRLFPRGVHFFHPCQAGPVLPRCPGRRLGAGGQGEGWCVPPSSSSPPNTLCRLSLAAKLLGLDVSRGWDAADGADSGDWAGVEALQVTRSCGCGSTL